MIAVFWRFSNYQNRWILNQDQARDVAIALYSLKTGQLPLIGSPSSAGPFNFGPLYHWLVIIVTALFPFPSGPWVAFTLLSCLSVIIFYQIGKNTGNHYLGLILAILVAVSPQQVAHAPDMLNTVIVFFLFSLSLLFFSHYLRLALPRHAFFFSFFLGFTLNCHFQALGVGVVLLLVFLYTVFFIPRPLAKLFGLIGGFLLAFLPLLVFDFTHQHLWSKSVFEYYTRGIHKFTLTYRWLTDLTVFWPQTLGQTVAGSSSFGYLGALAIITTTLVSFYRHLSLPKFWWLLLFSFVVQVILVRYYRGVRSPEYLIVFQPFLIFFTGYAVYLLSRFLPPLSATLLLLVLTLSTVANQKIALHSSSQAPLVYQIKNQLDQFTGFQPVSLFTHYGSDMINNPIFYLYYRQNLISPSGRRLGTCLPGPTGNPCPPESKIIVNQNGYVFYDLGSYSTDELSSQGFIPLTPQSYYQRLFINYGH